jgi:hypothetical protein
LDRARRERPLIRVRAWRAVVDLRTLLPSRSRDITIARRHRDRSDDPY